MSSCGPPNQQQQGELIVDGGLTLLQHKEPDQQ
jgi:hypothetical protein